MNRNVCGGWCMIGLGVLLASAAAVAEKAEPLAKPEGCVLPAGMGLEATLDLKNRYVWRGIVLNDDPVVQPGLELSYKGFSAQVWGSADTTDYGSDTGLYHSRQWDFQEVDYTVEYEHEVKQFTLSGGLVHYTYPGTGLPASTGVFAEAEYACDYVTPKLGVEYDYHELDGFYLYAELEHEFALTENERLSLTPLLHLGAASGNNNRYNFGRPGAALNDLALSASLDYRLTKALSVGLTGAYSLLPDQGIAAQARYFYGRANTFVVGLNLTFKL